MTTTTHRRRTLVVANESIDAPALQETLAAHAGATDVVVVAPAPNPRLRDRMSGARPGHRDAARRLDEGVADLALAGVRVDGWVSGSDPLQAIGEALAVFPADEILVAAQPDERAGWLAHDLVERACAQFSLPVLDLPVEAGDRRVALAA
jgi:hypothetical protein